MLKIQRATFNQTNKNINNADEIMSSKSTSMKGSPKGTERLWKKTFMNQMGFNPGVKD